jgi:hypothetical protein
MSIEYPVRSDGLTFNDRARFTLDEKRWVEVALNGDHLEIRGSAGLIIKPQVSNNIWLEVRGR